MKLGILVSGRGSNLEAILTARPRGIEPVIVISNRTGVRALEVAGTYGVRTRVLRRADFGGDASARDAAIGACLTDAGVELALLAGYDRLLLPSYFAAFGGATINIHPSLLPAHGGPGMLGLAVHAAVLAAGDTETGATVHVVTGDLDTGSVLSEVRVPVRPGDDVHSLAERVLAAEHALLVETLQRLAEASVTGSSRASMAPRASAARDST